MYSSSVYLKNATVARRKPCRHGRVAALACDDAIFHVSCAGNMAARTSAEALGPLGGELIDGANTSEETEARPTRLSIR